MTSIHFVIRHRHVVIDRRDSEFARSKSIASTGLDYIHPDNKPRFEGDAAIDGIALVVISTSRSRLVRR